MKFGSTNMEIAVCNRKEGRLFVLNPSLFSLQQRKQWTVLAF